MVVEGPISQRADSIRWNGRDLRKLPPMPSAVSQDFSAVMATGDWRGSKIYSDALMQRHLRRTRYRMSSPARDITIPVDLLNPGQFFACCGLLELADRTWRDVEGWFSDQCFLMRSSDADSSIGA